MRASQISSICVLVEDACTRGHQSSDREARCFTALICSLLREKGGAVAEAMQFNTDAHTLPHHTVLSTLVQLKPGTQTSLHFCVYRIWVHVQGGMLDL